MRSHWLTTSFLAGRLIISALLLTSSQVRAQSTGWLQGRVVDSTGAIVTGANVTAHNPAISLDRATLTDSEGNYLIAALPVGTYRIEVGAPGFRTGIVENLTVDVGSSVVQDFKLQVGELSQEMT